VGQKGSLLGQYAWAASDPKPLLGRIWFEWLKTVHRWPKAQPPAPPDCPYACGNHLGLRRLPLATSDPEWVPVPQTRSSPPQRNHRCRPASSERRPERHSSYPEHMPHRHRIHRCQRILPALRKVSPRRYTGWVRQRLGSRCIRRRTGDEIRWLQHHVGRPVPERALVAIHHPAQAIHRQTPGRNGRARDVAAQPFQVESTTA
jgi:hypothetical protein